MIRVLSLIALLVVIGLVFVLLTKFLPQVLRNRSERKRIETSNEHEAELKKEAFQRSYDLLTMLTYDAKVAALVYSGLKQHLGEKKFEEASQLEMEEFESYEKERIL